MNKFLLSGFALGLTSLAFSQCVITGIPASMCEEDDAVTATVVESGGTFSGPGMVGDVFDPSLAGPGTHTITFDYVASGYEVDESIAYSPIDISSGSTSLTLGDDAVTGYLPIGFSFNFFGSNFTDFKIGSNGFLTFNASSSNGCCSGQLIPNSTFPNELIAFAWEDLDPGNGGAPATNLIRYKTTGTAPFRVLVMEYFNVDHWPSGDGVYAHVQLYETTNCIEIHVGSQPQSGTHTLGIENVDGTEAYAAAGKNRSGWTATNYAVSFCQLSGCTGTFDVTVTAAPEVTASVDDDIICIGESVTFTAGGTADTYVWDPVDVIDGVPYSPEIGTATYTVTGTHDASGCENTASVVVTVSDYPTVVAGAGDGSFCADESVILTAGGDADTYTWDPTDLDPGIGTHTYTLTGEYTFSGCQSIDEVEITVHALPTVSASVDLSTVCVGNTVVLTGSGADSYSWDPTSIMDGSAYNPGDIGSYTYSVIGTDANGCTDNASVNVTVVEGISISATSTDVMTGDDGEINITVTGGVSPYTFDWDNDGTGDFDDTEDLSGLSQGVYTVVVNGSTGCSMTTNVRVGSQLGIDDLEGNTISVYPNPTTENVTIELIGEFDYQLTASDGAIILNGTGVDKEVISLEKLASGVYFVTIKVNNSTSKVKVIKE